MASVEQQLIDSLSHKNLDQATKLILEDCPINVKTFVGWISIHYICEMEGDHLNFLLLLYEKGATCEYEENEITPLHLAAKKGNKLIFFYLVDQKNFPFDTKTRQGETPLINAIQHDHVDIALALISKGANVNTICDIGTPLTSGSNLQICKALLEKGANINYCHDLFGTALTHAVLNSNFETAEFLLSKDIDVNLGHPLHTAMIVNNMEILKLLLSNGANINLQNHLGDTPLHWAMHSSQTNFVEFLILNGADVHIRDNCDKTPLEQVVNARQRQEIIIEILKILLKHGAKIDRKKIFDDRFFSPSLFCYHVQTNVKYFLLKYVYGIESDEPLDKCRALVGGCPDSD